MMCEPVRGCLCLGSTAGHQVLPDSEVSYPPLAPYLHAWVASGPRRIPDALEVDDLGYLELGGTLPATGRKRRIAGK